MPDPQTDDDEDSLFDPAESTRTARPHRLLPSSNLGLVILALAILSAFSHMVAVMYIESVPVLKSNALYQEIFSVAELEAGKEYARQITALAIGGYLFTILFAVPLVIRGILHRYV